MQKRSFFTTKVITRIGGLVALSVLLKSYLSLTDGYNWRFSLFGVPLIIVGLMYDPLKAIIAGFAVDFIYVLISPFAFTFNFMTLEAISFALIPSLMVLLIGRENIKDRNIVLSVIIAYLFGFIFNSLQLYIFFQESMIPFLPIRFIITIINIVINTYVGVIIYKRVIIPDLNIVIQK